MNHEVERKYAKPTVDFVFKRVFGSEKGKPALISLLNSILNLEITDLTLENPELTKDAEHEKGARLDVLATLDSGQKVDIEIQLGGKEQVDKRSLFYGSKLLANQTLKGRTYSSLVPVYVIFIIDFPWDSDSASFVQKFVLTNAQNNKLLFPESECFAILFVEFSKIEETEQIPKGKLERWLLFFKTQNDTLLEELKMSDPSLSDAITEIEVAKMTPAERRRYEAEIAYEIDQASKLECAINSGLKQGMQQGMEQGMQQGMQQGIQQGKELGEHLAKQVLLNKYVQKRFPDLGEKLKTKLSLLNNSQLDQILEIFADYPDQSSFEAALQGLEI